jgi:hypothetical protein
MTAMYLLFSNGFKLVALFDDWHKCRASVKELTSQGYSVKLVEVMNEL